MAIYKAVIAALVLSFLVLHFYPPADRVTVKSNGNVTAGPPLSQKIDCGLECERRCSLSSRPNLCKRACGTCCERCNCVPPGTSGNEDVCPCYASMTTHGGRHKCP